MTVRDALRFYSSDELRFFFLSTHYRRDMDLGGLEPAARRFRALRRAVRLLSSPGKQSAGKVAPPVEFVSALNDDFDTPRAIDAVEALVSDASSKRDRAARTRTRAAAASAMEILGVDLFG